MYHFCYNLTRSYCASEFTVSIEYTRRRLEIIKPASAHSQNGTKRGVKRPLSVPNCGRITGDYRVSNVFRNFYFRKEFRTVPGWKSPKTALREQWDSRYERNGVELIFRSSHESYERRKTSEHRRRRRHVDATRWRGWEGGNDRDIPAETCAISAGLIQFHGTLTIRRATS